MQAGQTGVGLNGKQNFLFPLEIMWLTQGCYEYTYSHDHTYAMDFQGKPAIFASPTEFIIVVVM